MSLISINVDKIFFLLIGCFKCYHIQFVRKFQITQNAGNITQLFVRFSYDRDYVSWRSLKAARCELEERGHSWQRRKCCCCAPTRDRPNNTVPLTHNPGNNVTTQPLKNFTLRCTWINIDKEEESTDCWEQSLKLTCGFFFFFFFFFSFCQGLWMNVC